MKNIYKQIHEQHCKNEKKYECVISVLTVNLIENN